MSMLLLLAGAERSLAAAIQQDPVTQQRLAALQGRVILIHSQAPELSVYLLPDSQGLRLASQHEGEPDCCLSAPATVLARLAISDERQQLLYSPEVELSGDTQLLVTLQNILADLQIDGEAALARWLGPVAAHAVGKLTRTSHRWLNGARQGLHQSISEYLTEEGQQLVGRDEADASSALLHELRLQLDRLDARVQRLMQSDTGTDA